MDSIRIPITKVPAIVEQATGFAPCLNTVRRWTRVGYRGVKLKVGGFGRERFTTQEWLDQFSTACGPKCETAAIDTDQSFERPSHENAARRRNNEAADSVLREFGIIK